MPKTVAVIVVKSPKTFTWLGHMPVITWCVVQLTEVRGVDRIVCVASPELAARAGKLLGATGIDVVPIPRPLADAKDADLDRWLTAADGPACDATTLVVTKATSPFLEAAKIEACVRSVTNGKYTHCQPARQVEVVLAERKTKAREAVASLRAFRVAVPAEMPVNVNTVPVTLIESLDVDDHDEFVVADALVTANKM